MNARLAAFSDTHGNLPALDAVLEDMARKGPFDHVLMAGDLVEGGPHPAETLAAIRALNCPVVLGNTDSYLLAEPDAPELAGMNEAERASSAWTAERIGPEGLAYLRSLPRQYHLPGPAGGILMVHANPDNLEDHIHPDEDAGALEERLAGVQAGVLVFGHLHIAYQRRLGRLLLVDVASAGFPRDGDHRAAWAEIYHDDLGWHATLHRIAYDMEAVAIALEQCGMPNGKKRAKVLRQARYKHR
ncbi:MAG TPA: metallophosphoesterase family protein [Chloroflexota bacterium]|nr:metallophosphoesterase family protein [Chloroflexota bacterium]